MKMVSHNCKAYQFSKIELNKSFDYLHQFVFFRITKGKSIKSGPGHHMAHSLLIRYDHTRNSWNDQPSRTGYNLYGMNIPIIGRAVAQRLFSMLRPRQRP
jgi:D-mannonate dehydratase